VICRISRALKDAGLLSKEKLLAGDIAIGSESVETLEELLRESP
jgi:hypothetical protein